ncbi:hypothetical protein SAMN05444161_2581 [Rhizobiales bacterium GAS191]|nr:hypothetical protein SAMN05444161_2581 [Rhizobiales bacterium GAS191]
MERLGSERLGIERLGIERLGIERLEIMEQDHVSAFIGKVLILGALLREEIARAPTADNPSEHWSKADELAATLVRAAQDEQLRLAQDAEENAR